MKCAPTSIRNPQSAIRNRREGFTLLELLVAMSLMVVGVLVSVHGPVHGLPGLSQRPGGGGAHVAAINVIELLKQDIVGVLPPGSTLAGAFVGTDSGGLKGVDADSLEFYTTHVYVDDKQLNGRTTRRHPLVGGIGKVALLLEEDSEKKDGTYRLVRQVTTNLLAPKEMEPEEQVLCRNVISLNFRYYDGDGWVDEWDSTADANSLPLAVEVDLQIAHKDKYSKELQKRRLIQSFAIPCKTETTESETTGTSTSGPQPARRAHATSRQAALTTDGGNMNDGSRRDNLECSAARAIASW